MMGKVLQMVAKVQSWAIHRLGGVTCSDFSRHIDTLVAYHRIQTDRIVREHEEKIKSIQSEFTRERGKWSRVYEDQTARIRQFLMQDVFGNREIDIRRGHFMDHLAREASELITEYITDHLGEDLEIVMENYFARLSEADREYRPWTR